MQEIGAPIRREFLAVVAGPLEPEGTLEGSVRSKAGHQGRKAEYRDASLSYRVLAGDDRLSLVRVVPDTHRRHQIRALFAAAGRPLAGDGQYGKKAPAQKFRERFGVDRPLLHARRIVVPGELLGRELSIDAPIPEDVEKVIAEKGWVLEPGPESR